MHSAIKFFSFILPLALCSQLVFAHEHEQKNDNDDPYAKISLKTIHVNGNVYMLENVGGFSGGNIGVSAGEDGILLVDDQIMPMTDKIDAALAEINPGKLRFILNTHWHGDHTGSNAHYAEQAKATIISHSNVRKRLMAEQNNMFGKSPIAPKKALPIITFDQAVNVHFNNEDIQLTHYHHGHTDSDSIVYFPNSKVAHLGDHYFNGMFPFVDITTGGNVFKLTENIKQIIASLPADTKIIPGHGGLSDMAGLKTYYRMLKETSTQVKQLAAEGKSLEEIQTAGLSKEWSTLGGGFINEKTWIMFIYQSLPQ